MSASGRPSNSQPLSASSVGSSDDPLSREVIEDELSAIEKIVPQVRKPEVRNAVRQILIAKREEYSGPLPHPRHLEHYETILSGSADRIFAMAEKEQSHRHNWENRYLLFDGIQGLLGQVLGALALLALIGASVYCASIGQSGIAIVLFGAATFTAVTAIIKRRMASATRNGSEHKSSNSRNEIRKPRSR